jgi:hypothetical protein
MRRKLAARKVAGSGGMLRAAIADQLCYLGAPGAALPMTITSFHFSPAIQACASASRSNGGVTRRDPSGPVMLTA